MIQLTALDDQTTVVAVPARRIVRMEVIVDKRGGHVHLTDGLPTSLGTRIYLDGLPEPLEVLEHLPDVGRAVDKEMDTSSRSVGASGPASTRFVTDGPRVDLPEPLAKGAPVRPGDQLP